MSKVFPCHSMVLEIAEHLDIENFIGYEMKSVDNANWPLNPVAWRGHRHCLRLKFFFEAPEHEDREEFQFEDEGQTEVVYINSNRKPVWRAIRCVEVLTIHNGSVGELHDFKKFVSVDSYEFHKAKVDIGINLPQTLLNIGNALFPSKKTIAILNGETNHPGFVEYEPKVLSAFLEVCPSPATMLSDTRLNGEALARYLMHFLATVDDYEKWGYLTVKADIQHPRHTSVTLRAGRTNLKEWVFKP